MDCRRFLDQHALLVDLRCSAVEENEMRQHMRACPSCAHHDALIRRSLMLVRSLPTIEPSPDFRARLDARLRATRQAGVVRASHGGHLSLGTFVTVAATLAFVAFLAAALRRQPSEIRMAPVVASAPPEQPASHLASSALVATVPTGMSVWPAIMTATQAPVHLVATELAAEH